MTYPTGWLRLALPLTATAALLAGLAAVPAHAQPAPWRASGNWRSYLEQPKSSDVKAVSATVLSGSVVNGRGLTAGGRGDTTLRVTPGSRPAIVLLDYGAEAEGTPYIDVDSYRGAGLSVSLAFSESRTYMRTPGSGMLAAAATAGDTSISVKPLSSGGPLTFAAGDTVTVGFPTEVNHIVSVSGSTLTLKAPLADAHPAGAAVTSSPGAVTGDSAFQPRDVPLAISATGGTTRD